MDIVSTRDVAKAMAANNKVIDKKIEEAVDVVSDRIVEVEKRLGEVRHEAKQAAASAMADVLDARAGGDLTPSYSLGKAYKVGDIVRHNKGLWQAFLDTERPPGEDGSGWVPYVNGVASQRVEVDGIRELSFVTAYSDGSVDRTDHKIPVPLHTGKWEQAKAYDHGDMVMWDGCTWYCNADSNTDEPGLTKSWVLAAQRGERGKKGETGARGEKGDRGERGERGPQGEQGLPGVDGQDADPVAVAELIVRAMGGDEEAVEALGPDRVSSVKGLLTYALPSETRVQLFSRGAYQRGERYERGDMVSITGVGLYVALTSTIADPATNSPDWQTVAVITPGGGGGGPVSGATTFTQLLDTPNTMGAPGRSLRVNAAGNALEFYAPPTYVISSTTAPPLPTPGQIWFIPQLGKFAGWTGTGWVSFY